MNDTETPRPTTPASGAEGDVDREIAEWSGRALWAENIIRERDEQIAALRDRLARAEAEAASLRGLMNEWEHQDSTRDLAYRDDLCDRWSAALAGAPLDSEAGPG